MFNTKRIIFLIGLLSIVALTGALMAGPAFANPGHGKGKGGPGAAETAKVAICHYGEERLADADLGITAEDAAWAMIDVDMESEDSHVGMHSDGTTSDFLIVDEATTDACVALLPVEPLED